MIGILAVGNEMRGDDGVGIFAGRLLERKGFPVIFAHETPENVLGRLRRFDRIIVLDAAHFEAEEPFRVVHHDPGGYSHKPGLSKLSKFLDADLLVVGIKTYKRALLKSISPQAQENARTAVKVVEVCMALPGVVVDPEKKVVDLGGKEKELRFAVPNLKQGDFVLVHAGVVVEKLSKDEYEKFLEALPHEDKHL